MRIEPSTAVTVGVCGGVVRKRVLESSNVFATWPGYDENCFTHVTDHDLHHIDDLDDLDHLDDLDDLDLLVSRSSI